MIAKGKERNGRMDQLYWVWLLSIPEIGNTTRQRLLAHLGSPQGIYESDGPALKAIEGLKPEKREVLIKNRDLRGAEKAIRYMERHHIRLITQGDAAFPSFLHEIYNPPTAFFVKGNVELLKAPLNIGIVGSRKASPGGLAQARRLSRDLSENGVTVVSGFAAGIDAASHEGALEGVGSTIAVLGCGINVCYPKANKPLYHEILEGGGLILTEFFMDTQPLAFHFPLRNRIISGLSQGLLVVEAAEKSGALITAKHALEQGKNVYAIPKDITLVQSVGCNNLIKDGAKVVTEARDVLEDYVDFVPVPDGEETVKSVKNLKLSEDEAKLFNLVARGYNTTDQLVLVSEKTIAEVNALLSMMELRDILRVDYGRVTLL